MKGGGIFFHSERIDHGVSSLRNVTFKDIYSTTSSISRGHAISTYGYITINIDNLYCENINSYTSDGPLIFLNEDIDINIYNAYIKKIYGNGVGALFINTVNTNNVRIMVENLNFSDSYIKSYQNTAVLLWINGGRFVGTKWGLYQFENIHLCYKNKECAVNKDSISELDRSSIAQLYSRSTLIMEDVLFNNVYGETCFYNSRYSTTNIKNSNFSNIYEESGIFKFSSKDYFYGTFNIRNSTFNNNRSLKGGVIHVEDVENANYLIVFYDSFFYNNAAELYGGVIFSIHSSVKERVIFENCEFYNNTAEFGNLAYSLNIDSEPIFVYNDTSKLSQLKSIKNTFVTNPSKLVINEDSNKINDILSGDIIHDDIIVNIYDDYGSKFSFGSNVDKLNIDELVFFKVEIEDTEGKKDNVVLFGQTQEYCWEDACSINNIKIVGNPGNYVFKLKLLTYGSYSEFDDNEVSLDVTIKECDESKYIYQTKDHSVLKSCYTPHCDPSCNSGNCINDNVCDCSNTPYTGLHCNEYYKLERNIFMYDLYQIIAIVLFVITMICLALLLVYKNASIIKGGGFEFLIIILVGITYNCGYIIFLSKERLNVKRCVLMYAMRNMGFALVFGSILVKTLRIYIIFKHVRHSTSFKLYKMYLIIASIFLFHVMLLFLWICFDKISCNAQYTKDEKEFYDCQFPNTKIFSFVFNTSILIVGVILAYSIRYVNDNFKEQLAVPVYIYTVLSLFSEIVDHIDDLTLFFKDSVGVLVTSLSSLVVLYFLYIQKFYAVAHQNKRERSRNIGSVFVKQYPRRSGLS
ncbi:hypothetical protein BCR36DRAFT_369322 [Piromyces finnis]|uniref:G-protein coupled receptors family 3 profile domain-containing protein n=1 Tax=Piromyces finnis TaxID=1754191 RepID=A0A1Y1VC13_9FUNG|nr:hypothetical protein BCR36DRAFT_369322 [Piromyces finnis]|eukprot:ORX52523.1 hypothetical protein BCR36DRAFT_369322 [Piromyces finnis]